MSDKRVSGMDGVFETQREGSHSGVLESITINKHPPSSIIGGHWVHWTTRSKNVPVGNREVHYVMKLISRFPPTVCIIKEVLF